MPAVLAALLLLLPVTASAGGGLHGACVLHLDDWEGRLDREATRALYARLAGKGARAVALPAFVWQDSLDAVELRPWDGRPEARGELARAVRDARSAGLAVLLKPHLEIGRGGERVPGAWRGTIEFDDAARAAAWFAGYRAFVVDLARLAEEEGVEVLAVGLELAGLSSAWPEQWERLVREVRAVYPGRLTYCANWWGEFGTTSIWERLDLLGVQAFAPLSDSRRASPKVLRRGAREQVAAWRSEAGKWGKPLLVTEFGYKSSPSPWIEPWQWEPGAARPLEQLHAYRALLAELEAARGDWLAGSFVWLYEAGRPAPGPTDAGFSPGGKPVEALLERWWRGLDSGGSKP